MEEYRESEGRWGIWDRCSFSYSISSPTEVSLALKSRGSWCIRVLQRNRPIGCAYMRRFGIGIGSWGYGGREVPWSAVPTLEARRARGVIQPKTEGLRIADGSSPDLSLKSESQSSGVRSKSRRWCLSSGRGRKFTLSLLFALFRPHLVECCLRRPICFTQFSTSNISLFQAQPHRHIQK